MSLFSVTVAGGPQDIIKNIGFKARTLLIDNYTNTWYWIQEVDYFIPPKWVGVIIPLDHMTDYIQLQVRNPFKPYSIDTGIQATSFDIHIKATDQEFEYNPGRAYQDITNAGSIYITSVAYATGPVNSATLVNTPGITDIGPNQSIILKVPRLKLWRTATATIAGSGSLVITFDRFWGNFPQNFITVGNAIAAGETQIVWEYESDLRPLYCVLTPANNKQIITMPAGGAGVTNHGYFQYEYWYAY